MRGLLILIWTIGASGAIKDYTNYKVNLHNYIFIIESNHMSYRILLLKVLRVNVKNERDADLLLYLREKESVYDFWSEIRSYVEIMTSPEDLDRLTSWLKRHKMTWSVMISNVQERIDQEKIESQVNSTSLEASFLSYYMDWNSYQSEATILGWLKNVMEPFRDFCKTEVIGQTFEGRNMTIMKVS